MRRHVSRLLLAGALLSPATLYALGLGEIRLNSALNQPFDADIELIAPTSEELATLKIGLASNDLFARYNLDRPAYLSNFDFSIARGPDGRATIKVTSTRSVTEPFVTLFVEATWGRGRLLREYTVLLDPPVFMPTQPEAQAPVVSAQSGAPTEGRIERRAEPATTQPQPQVPAPQAPAPTEAVLPAPASASTPMTMSLGGSYSVARNDTLWRIASNAQPGASPSVINRTMIALFRANPEAFDGNINRLRAGSVLRIPEQAEIDAISRAEAAAEVGRQQQEWSSTPRTATSEEPSRLRLVPPAEVPSAPRPAAPVETQTAAPPGPAAQSVAPADRRFEITNPDLANAQQSVSEAPITPDPAAEAPIAPKPEQATAEQQSTESEPSAGQPAATQPPAQRPARVTPPQSEEASLLNRLTDFWWVLVVLGLVVVGLLAFLKRRREQSDLTSLSDSVEGFKLDSAKGRAPTLHSRERVDDFIVGDSPGSNFEEFDDSEQPALAPRRNEGTNSHRVELDESVIEGPTSDDTLSSETAVRFDQQDALAEADFHMAYGLYDQAADLVKIAIDREPARRELKLKLLEIYFVWGNKDLFLDTARELSDGRDAAAAGEWDKVLIMGKQIAPEDPLFMGEGGAHVDLVDVNLEGGENRVDLDLFAEPQEEGADELDLQFASGERSGIKQASADLDFLLDDDQSGRDEEPTREFDPLARTQETPTIESPMLDRSATTMRENVDPLRQAKNGTEQTAELSLDDLGLDVDSLEATGSLEDTTSLERDSDTARTRLDRPLRDDEMTQLAPSIGSFDRTLETPHVEDSFDLESTGSVYIDEVDLTGGHTVEQPRPDVDATAALARATDIDVDLDSFDAPDEQVEETLHESARDGEVARFSDDVFADRTAAFPRVDLDVGDPLLADDREPTNKVITTEMELSELEPVTMSEVGTKLDLARAYMDMGDPDGARSILEEVAQEGNPGQKQEAQRLLESIR